MHKHTCGDVRFRTCTYKHTHGHRTNTVHTRETIKVSLAKRNTLYVCSWICTIKCVHVCMSARFRKRCNRTFCTSAYVPYLKCVCEWWCVLTVWAMCPCSCRNGDMLLSGSGPLFSRSPGFVSSPYFEVPSRWDTQRSEKPAVWWGREGRRAL